MTTTHSSAVEAADNALHAVVAQLMRTIDAYAFDYAKQGKLAPMRRMVTNELRYTLSQAELASQQDVAAPVGDAAETLKLVCDALGIGVLARTPQTILMNIENARRRSDCLWRVEHEFFMTSEPDEDDPDGEPFETCLLNWGDDPDEYVKKFGEALAASRVPVASVARWIPVTERLPEREPGEKVSREVLVFDGKKVKTWRVSYEHQHPDHDYGGPKIPVFENANATHWMDKPPPPTPEQGRAVK